MSKTIDVYKHIYDNPKNQDGTDKPNEFLGTFEVVHGSDDDYSFDLFARKDGKLYKIVGREVSGMYGHPSAGTICHVERMQWIDNYIREAIERSKPDSRRLMPNNEQTQHGFDVATRMFERNLRKELGLDAPQGRMENDG